MDEKCVIVKNVRGWFSFGEFEDGRIVPLIEIVVHFQDGTFKKYTILKGTEENEENFVNRTFDAMDEMNKSFYEKEFDENEFYNVLNKHILLEEFYLRTEN